MAAGFSTNALTVGTSATQIAGARFNRRVVKIQNTDAAAIFVGASNVTTSGATKGLTIAANGSETFETVQGALFAISAAGTAANAVVVVESFG